MASHYYLISSLPMLRADMSNPIDYNTFLGMCKSSVNASTYAALEGLSVNSDSFSLMKNWTVFYKRLQDELSYQRNMKLGKTCTAPDYRDTAAIVETALSAENPLKGEQILMELEFNQIDSLIGLHYFDDTFLFGYAIKLKLLERQRAFQFEQGKQEFISLLDSIQKQIFSL